RSLPFDRAGGLCPEETGASSAKRASCGRARHGPGGFAAGRPPTASRASLRLGEQVRVPPSQPSLPAMRPLARRLKGAIMPSHEKHLLAVAATLLVVGLGLFAYMRGPAQMIARPAKGSTVSYKMLDGCLGGYTQDDVELRLKAWSADQVATYRAVHLGPDMVFPWVYSGFFFVTAVLGFGWAYPRRTLWPFLLVIPVLTLTADYVENSLISFVILPAGWPADAATVAWAS